MKRVETLIVGAGQAGLAMSRCLTDLAIDHVLLERGRVAERWRTERWDSLRLLTPNWQTRLLWFTYDGPEPDGFMTMTRVVGFLECITRNPLPRQSKPTQRSSTSRQCRPASACARIAERGWPKRW